MNVVTLGILEETFGNLLTDVLFGVFILVGICLGIFLRPWIGNTVIKLMDNFRFEEFDILEETAISLICKIKKGFPPQRFFKLQYGYTGMMGKFIKKPVTRFFGREGTAYTTDLEKGKTVELGKLDAAVKHVLGEEFYDEIPEKQKQQLQESKIAVTVQLPDASLTPTGMRSVSEEDIKTEEDRRAAETFWAGKKKAERGAWINLILGIGTGFAICAGLVLLGVFKTPGGEAAATPAPTTNPTVAIIWQIVTWLI